MTLRRMAVGLSMMFCCSAAIAITYTWTDAGGDQNWTTCGNWSGAFSPCYPNQSGHDVLIGAESGEGEYEVTLDFGSLTIDDMTIVHGVKFASTGIGAVLTMETLTIDATDIALDIYVDEATLIAN